MLNGRCERLRHSVFSVSFSGQIREKCVTYSEKEAYFAKNFYDWQEKALNCTAWKYKIMLKQSNPFRVLANTALRRVCV